MRPLHYKISSWLLAFVIGVASTFVLQSCLRSVPVHSVSQLQMPALKLPALPDKAEARQPAAEVATVEDDEPQRSIALKFRKYSVSEKAEGFYENVADYPQLEVLTTEKARRFNRYVEDSIMNRFKDARAQGKQLIREIQQNGDPERIVGGLTSTYKILFASPDIISIRFTHSYLSIFHPIDGYESINYDLKTGRPLQLREVFRPKVNYLQALSRLSRKKLLELFGMEEADWWMKKGTAPTEENFDAWNLTHKGLVISFADYQVGVGAWGAPEITIPLTELKNFLKQKYLYLR
ncbi:MAG TPA: DUF3298 domain-containing protein [Pyrinomonadaceae bacterium]